MSCEITTRATPNSSRRSARLCRITRWIVTSSAVVGSSAMIRSGSRATQIAISTRCFIPPDNSCGYICATRVSSPTWRSSRGTISRTWLRRCGACSMITSANWSRMRITGLSEFIEPCGR